MSGSAGGAGCPARLLPCGERAVLVEVSDLDEVLALHEAITGRRRHPGADHAWAAVVDVVPAARTVLVSVDDPRRLAALRSDLTLLLAGWSRSSGGTGGSPGPGQSEPGQDPLVLSVRYDGEDLDEVGELTGLGAQGVVNAHTGTRWRVAFGGFAPGFAYLYGGDPRLRVPRRASPRTRVPAGSVGLAGEYSGVYPTSSPGGWQLIGRTDAVLWDAQRDPPALLTPGRWVSFEAT
ncbi:MAG: 5-oxoprolinase subunit B family protein [Actinomycetales bacterium]